MNTLERMPPANKEAEQSLLGGLLIDPSSLARVMARITGDDFYYTKHRMIYEVIVSLWSEGSDIDLLTVSDRLEANGNLDPVGGTDYLIKLTVVVPTSIHVETYANVIREKAKRRGMIAAAGRLAELAFDETQDLDTVTRQAETEVFSATERQEGERLVTVAGAMSQLYDEMELVTKRGQGAILGVPTGYTEVDTIMDGYFDGDFTILAARPSVGKTAYALNVGLKVAKRGSPVLFLSHEMSMNQLSQRLIAMATGLNLQDVRKANFDDAGRVRYFQASEYLSALPIIFSHGGYTPAALQAEIRRAMLMADIKLVIIDYLQLMEADVISGSRQERMASISRAIKKLARSLGLPVLALSQLSRGLEGRIDKRPILSDLRESGALEQDADVVVFLYRAEMYEPDTQTPGIMEHIVSKNRNGPTGTAYLHFKKETGQIVGMKSRLDDASGMQIRMPEAF